LHLLDVRDFDRSTKVVNADNFAVEESCRNGAPATSAEGSYAVSLAPKVNTRELPFVIDIDSHLVQLVHCGLEAVDSFVMLCYIRGLILDYCPRSFTNIDEFCAPSGAATPSGKSDMVTDVASR
jgi:hypothetical protein